MMLFVRLLSQIEEIIHSYNLEIFDATSLTFAAIQNDIIMNWQQYFSRGKQKQQHQGVDAKKLSNYHDLVKWLSHYLYFFYFILFYFLIWTYYTKKKYGKVLYD